MAASRPHSRRLGAAFGVAMLFTPACGEFLPPVAVELVPEGEGSLLPPPPPTAHAPEDAAVPPPASGPDAALEPDGALGPVEPVLPPDPPGPATEAPVRPRRRMDIDQLDASIRRVTGGIGWTEMRNGVEINLFVDLSATLGKADFIQTTVDNLETSAIFQKFLGDAARSVCERRIAADLAAPNPADRVVMPAQAEALEPGALETRLGQLRSDFHSLRMLPDSPEMASWRWLYESTMHVSGQPARAWNAVCVALLTHPDFYTY